MPRSPGRPISVARATSETLVRGRFTPPIRKPSRGCCVTSKQQDEPPDVCEEWHYRRLSVSRGFYEYSRDYPDWDRNQLCCSDRVGSTSPSHCGLYSKTQSKALS